MVVAAEEAAEEELEEVKEEVVVVTAVAAVAVAVAVAGGGGGWWASARGERARERESYGYRDRGTRSSRDRVHGSAGARRAWEGCARIGARAQR